jgi:cell division protease FtsH
MSEIEEAVTKVIAGPEKKSRVISEDERRLTAFHEAGHAIVARALPNTDPVHQITIIPRGRAGGFTMILPKEDKYYTTKTKMMENIVHLLGGRVAEKLTLNDISTGASNDISRATEIARDMVTKYGFSDRIGPVNYSSADEVFLGKDFSTRKNYSEEMASEIDDEVRNLIEEAYRTAEAILKEYSDNLHVIANALLEAETLDGEQFEDLFTGKMTPEQLLEKIEHDEKYIQRRNAEEAAETEKLLSLPEGDDGEEDDEEDEEGAENEDGSETGSGKRQVYREYNASGRLRKSFKMKTKRLSTGDVSEDPPDADSEDADDGDADDDKE